VSGRESIALTTCTTEDLTMRSLPGLSLLAFPLLTLQIACGDPRPVTEAPTDDAQDDVVVTPVTPSIPAVTPGPSFGHCEGGRAWFTERDYWSMLNSQLFTFTPDEGLILLADEITWGAFAYRSDDGAVLPGPQYLYDASDGFERVLVRDWTTNALVVRDRASNVALHSFVPDANIAENVVSGALDAKGESVALVTCTNGAFSLRVHELAHDGESSIVHESALYANAEELSCWFWGELVPTVAFVPQSQAVIVSVPSAGTIVHVDLATHVDTRVVAHTAPPDDEERLWIENGPLLAFTIAPDGSHVATTGSDARLRRFKLPTLTEIDDGREVSVHLVNQYVYAPPRLVSPTAISPDGLVIAEVGFAGQPVLRDTRNGELLVELPAPTFENDLGLENVDEFMLERSRPVSFAFSPSGRQFAVSYSGGIALFRCDDVEITQGEPLSVGVEGPSVLTLYDAGVFTVDVGGSDAVFTTSVSLAENLYATSIGLHEVHITGYAAGEYELVFTVDNGRSVGETTRFLSITE